MNVWLGIGFVGVMAYLLGSIPTGYWAGKLLRGIDIREHGSRSTGATNVLRTLGKGPALAVFLIDVLKGVMAIALTRWLYAQPSMAVAVPSGVELQSWAPWMVTLAGLMAIVGHSKSMWIGFKGGKSAATGLGVLFAMSWLAGLSAAAVFLLVLAVSRIVSLGSILTAVSAPIWMLLFQQPLPYVLLALAGGLYVVITHRANIQRLRAGTEPKVGQRHQEQSQS